MKILALEFSTDRRSVAVVDDDRICGRAQESGTRARGALGLVESALREAGLEREQVDCLAIGLGPGSYTGIRAAIALAQGWQLARRVRLLGLSSVECIAAQAQADGFTGKACVVIDAQREEFYVAGYDVGVGECHEVFPLRLAKLPEVRERANAGETLIGPEVTRWFPDGRVMFPRAATSGRLAMTRGEFVPGEKLEPIYLRETVFVKAPPPRVLPVG